MKTENHKISGPSPVIEHRIAAGIGAPLLGKTDDPVNGAEQTQNCLECDLCGRHLQDDCTCSIGAAACLCVQCVKRLQNIADGPIRESFWRFINKNVV